MNEQEHSGDQQEKPKTPKEAAEEVLYQLLEFERCYSEDLDFEGLPEIDEIETNDPLIRAVRNLEAFYPANLLPLPGKSFWRRFFMLWRSDRSRPITLDAFKRRKREGATLPYNELELLDVLDVTDAFQQWLEQYYQLIPVKQAKKRRPRRASSKGDEYVLRSALLQFHVDQRHHDKPLTQKQLAEMLGWNQPHTSRVIKQTFGGMKGYKRAFQAAAARGFRTCDDSGRKTVEPFFDPKQDELDQAD